MGGGGYILSDKLAKLIIKRKIVYIVQQHVIDVATKLIIKS